VQLTHEEAQQAKRYPLAQVRADLSVAWKISESTRDFEFALAEKGYRLAAGNKVPLAIDGHGIGYPLLRSINIGRKVDGMKPIRKAELTRRLPDQLPDLESVKNMIKDEPNHADQLPEENDMDTGLKPRLLNKACGTVEDATSSHNVNKRKKLKEQLITAHYGNHLHTSELAKYWRPRRMEDGSFRLENKAGTIIDQGDTILVQVRANKHLPGAAAAIELAKMKGWNQLKVDGSDEFKKEMYRLAKRHGIKIVVASGEDKKLWETVNSEQIKYQEQANNVSHSPRQHTNRSPKM
jgi:hypothetical protein